MRRILFTLMSLACSLALGGTTVYKWVDDNGVVHYSDQPHPNAEKLELQGVQTYSAGAATVRGPADFGARPASSGAAYKGCLIVQPVDQQNLPNAQSVAVRVASEPMPRAEDRVFIMMDGLGVNAGQPTGLSFNVSPIDRGEHTVSAQIKGPGDQVLCRTPPVTFYVQQHTVLSPAPAGQPGGAPRPR